MKMRVVLDKGGQIVAAQEAADGPAAEAGLIAGPGQQLREVELPQGTVLSKEDPALFHQELMRHIRPGAAG